MVSFGWFRAAAVAAAEAALPAWRKWPAEDWSRQLLKIADLIGANPDCLARAENQDNGNPLWGGALNLSTHSRRQSTLFIRPWALVLRWVSNSAWRLSK